MPLPGRGHWAKPAYRRPKRPPVPLLPGPPRISRAPGAQIRLRNQNAVAEPLSESERSELAIVECLEQRNADGLDLPASEPDVLVKRTRRALTRVSTDGRKVLCPRAGLACLDVRVSKQSLNRALQILDHLLAILRAEGFSVTVAGTGRESTNVRILDQDIRFGLLENIRTIRPVMPAESGKQFTSIFDRPALEYEPTGGLHLQIWNGCPGVRKS